MIFIQSISADPTTTNVIKWLKKWECSWFRLNDVAKVKTIRYIDNDFIFDLGNQTIALSNIKAYWYRRGKITNSFKSLKFTNKDFKKKYENFLGLELESILDFFLEQINERIPSIGNYHSSVNVNKHIILLKAQKLGLNIPQFIITNKKDEVSKFFSVHKKIITKPLHSPFDYHSPYFWYPTYTESISKEFIESLPLQFQNTFFQVEVIKEFEIRIFYLMGEFYSMAIFSQRNPQTQTDFRVYDYQKPNRKVPYNIPSVLKKKLLSLLQELKLESASIDVLYSKDGDYYFLEVNPIGQFSMVSYACNYFLEKKIAEKLNEFESL